MSFGGSVLSQLLKWTLDKVYSNNKYRSRSISLEYSNAFNNNSSNSQDQLAEDNSKEVDIKVRREWAHRSSSKIRFMVKAFSNKICSTNSRDRLAEVNSKEVDIKILRECTQRSSSKIKFLVKVFSKQIWGPSSQQVKFTKLKFLSHNHQEQQEGLAVHWSTTTPARTLVISRRHRGSLIFKANLHSLTLLLERHNLRSFRLLQVFNPIKEGAASARVFFKPRHNNWIKTKIRIDLQDHPMGLAVNKIIQISSKTMLSAWMAAHNQYQIYHPDM